MGILICYRSRSLQIVARHEEISISTVKQLHSLLVICMYIMSGTCQQDPPTHNKPNTSNSHVNITVFSSLASITWLSTV